MEQIIGQILTSEPPPTRITRIQIQRLHNLGNYESVRYEVTVDVSEKDDAGKVLATLETALNDIRAKAYSSIWDFERAKKKLEKPDELEQWERESYQETVAAHEAAQAKREAARRMLSSFSVVEEKRDAKETWDDDEDYR